MARILDQSPITEAAAEAERQPQSRYWFELATPADDAELRSVLARTPMPGRVFVSFRREPSYFESAVVDGTFRQVGVVRDMHDGGRIVGFGSRSVRQRYVNGEAMPIGYLSSLRLLPEHRNLGLMARGYRYFRKLHADGRAPLYLTTIAEGNQHAISLLESGRAGLPTYHFAGRYYTLAIPLVRRRFKPRRSTALEVRPATMGDLPNVAAFLQGMAGRRQFFPAYEADELFNAQGAFRDFQAEDLLLAFRAGRLVGTLGGWDQSRYRQTVVEAYAGPLRSTSNLYNAWAKLSGRPRLPKPGQAIRYISAALPAVLDDDADVCTALLDKLIEQWAGHGCQYLLLGLHETDPLLAVAQRYRLTSYVTRLYHVCWKDGDDLRPQLAPLPPYLELGSL